ncbi:MAG: flagellar export protein FliJ [Treponema sp.]|nr:flagellar export protein FliJ [Treponema sp.]
MKRFNFSLEKVLELRRYREQETEIELGRAMGELTAIEQNLKRLAEERSLAAAGRFSPGNSAADIRNYELYILRLDIKKEELLEAAAKAAQKVEEARRNYLEASRDRKVMDKLREKRAAEYRRETLAGETAILDDMAARNTNRVSR